MADEEQQPGGAAATTTTTEGTTTSTTISLDDLSLEQLDQLKQREEQRLNALSVRYQQLRSVSARLSASQSAVHELPKKNTTDDAAVEAFVPLTESVYVPAMHDPDSPLLVDLGTGYYVEKSHQETMEFLDRKIRLVDANSDNITQAIQATRQNLDSIAMAVRGKLIEIQARRQGAMAMRQQQQQQQQRGAGPTASS